MTRNLSFLLAFFYLIVFITTTSIASDKLPPYWPWKGVSLNSNDSTTMDIPLLKEHLQQLNFVRLTLNVRFLEKKEGISPEEALSKTLEWTDSMLDACRDTGITAVISFNDFPTDISFGFDQTSPKFWNNTERTAEAVQIAGILAKHYSSRGTELAAYEILNEPLVIENDGTKKVPSQWPTLMNAIITEIRKFDSRWIVVTPGPGGMPTGYKYFTPIEANSIIYGAHMYIPHTFTHQGIGNFKLGFTYPGRINLKFWNKRALEDSFYYLRAFQKQYDVPIWIGEFSAVRWAPGAENYLIDLVNIFNSYGWGWDYFSYKEYQGWNPNYDSSYSSNNPDEVKLHYVGMNSVRWKTLKKIFE